MWILFGLIIGIIANNIDESRQNSIIGWIGVSILGAIIGGLLASLIFQISPISAKFNPQNFFTALIMSLFLIFSTEAAVSRERIKFIKELEKIIHRKAFRKV